MGRVRVRRKNPQLRILRNFSADKERKEQRVLFGKVHRTVVLSAIAIAFITSLIAGYAYIMNNYAITNVSVDGNIHYTDDEIIAMVMNGRYERNSIFLSMKYRNKGIENVPFVETMDVEVETKDTVRIKVYEKAVAGYVAYLGRYVYFDKDGIIVETSEEATPGIPQVTGLAFDHVTLYEPLPIENKGVFKDILNITQLLDKYSMPVDKIYFDEDYQVTLVFGEVKAALGKSGDIDEKIMKLQYMLPDLEGKSGTLNMKEYKEDTLVITFEKN